ncbi:MAG: histidine kinase [Muribaculaceae bacterium]|nr:histidine kinase [Muribaculaceae bacterium]
MYISIWLVMFLAPLISVYAHSTISDNIDFSFHAVLHLWDYVAVMLVIFLIHNQFLAPKLLNERKVKFYVIGVVVLFASFLLYVNLVSVPPPPAHKNQHIEKMVDSEGDTLIIAFPEKDWKQKNVGHMPPIELIGEKDLTNYADRPPISPDDLMVFMLLAFILASNLGLKFYYKNLEQEKLKQELDKEVLQQELSYLKYQVNPHFLMNTLNNIHALVDIDPEKSKLSIVKLSHLLRYMLYEGTKPTIPLDRALVFLDDYIELMRMRCDEKLEFVFDKPSPVPNVDVLPLLVVSFVENAFKHGVSSVEPSYIHLSIQVKDNHVVFDCENSKHHENSNGKMGEGGFGIANVKKRLDLMFGNNYDLNIDETDTTYRVNLTFPLDYSHN